ncbi:Uncharacterised protein [Anaerobiospirillum thomasii]|nr:Uncharacterised protein [Anaerobiospirillum thomasii]
MTDFNELSINIDLVLKTNEGKAVLKAILDTLNLSAPTCTTDPNMALAFCAKRDLMLQILNLFTNEQLQTIRGNSHVRYS